jgi:hypothetical protein
MRKTKEKRGFSIGTDWCKDVILTFGRRGAAV